ncbi:MAG TPA: ergothioneine biosynthesis protein EgtB [Thermoanaerobaculia bacterium]|nr:ergothioneine biosynthesis protein EgtB [Thermoanaerobaculia bacterium]
MNRNELLDRYRQTRNLSVELCRPLRPEDYRIQSMPDVSPPWWNLGHTTWFFAKNILEPFGLYSEDDARLEYVMNSYYESLGPRIRRDHRGLVTRPGNEEVYRFRESVDGRVEELIRTVPEADLERVRFLVFTGIQHEQQHQELLVTEIKHILGSNVPGLREPYRPSPAAASAGAAGAGARWVSFEGGLHDFGNVEGGWCWDNEMPVHKGWLEAFALSSRLVTNAEYLEFMADGGYRNPLLWLSNGWARVQDQGWTAPLYWEEDGAGWRVWTLSGDRGVEPDEPVSHVSFYEADAFARWRGARLPTEREWEQAARVSGFPGGGSNFLDTGALHPRPAHSNGSGDSALLQMGGDLWEWTSSHYEPYPGYAPFAGALMEYNGKFMDNVRILRGGSCATPGNHIRASYRNFWAGDIRFQFTGIRLAKGLG